MQISLGQEVQKRCKTCGMEYVPSSPEDRKLHDKYHRHNTEGYDVGKDFVRNAREGTVFEVGKKGDVICLVDCNDKTGRKMKAQAVLDIVQRELGAVEIDEDDIWDAKKRDASRHKSYLYLRGTKCLGFLLVEGISEARQNVAPDKSAPAQERDTTIKKPRSSNAASALRRKREAAVEELEQSALSPIELSKESVEATLGVSRIWTSSRHRHQHIASSLLDTALRLHMQTIGQQSHTTSLPSAEPRNRGHFSALDKDNVAFSQPTESGARLARRWFGKAYEWKIYVD